MTRFHIRPRGRDPVETDGLSFTFIVDSRLVSTLSQGHSPPTAWENKFSTTTVVPGCRCDLGERVIVAGRAHPQEIHLPAMSPFLPHGHQRLFMGWPWETEGKVHEAGRSPTVGSPVLWVFPPFWSHFVAGLLGPVGQPLTTK